MQALRGSIIFKRQQVSFLLDSGPLIYTNFVSLNPGTAQALQTFTGAIQPGQLVTEHIEKGGLEQESRLAHTTTTIKD